MHNSLSDANGRKALDSIVDLRGGSLDNRSNSVSDNTVRVKVVTPSASSLRVSSGNSHFNSGAISESVLLALKVSEGDNARLVVNTESLVGNDTSTSGSETEASRDRSRPLAISSLNLNSVRGDRGSVLTRDGSSPGNSDTITSFELAGNSRNTRR